MSLQVKFYPYGPLHENTYLVTDEDSGLKAIIDPGYFGEDVLADIGNPNTLKYIFLTHGHFDHLFAACDYKDNFDVELVAPLNDKYLVNKDWTVDYLTRGLNMTRNCPEPDRYVVDNEIITLGGSEFKFIDTPGHTEGGMCILCDDKLFSGDTLFRMSVGNTSLETGSWEALKNSIENRLYVLDEDTVVYTGHGAATTIGYEKRANPFV